MGGWAGWMVEGVDSVSVIIGCAFTTYLYRTRYRVHTRARMVLRAAARAHTHTRFTAHAPRTVTAHTLAHAPHRAAHGSARARARCAAPHARAHAAITKWAFAHFGGQWCTHTHTRAHYTGPSCRATFHHRHNTYSHLFLAFTCAQRANCARCAPHYSPAQTCALCAHTTALP